jgi:hypothetical protein
MKKSIFATLLLAGITFSSSVFPDVFFGEKTIIIHGEIAASDFDQLSDRQSELAYKDIGLISSGGDVTAALNIGRLIRQYEGNTTSGFPYLFHSDNTEAMPLELQNFASDLNLELYGDLNIDERIEIYNDINSRVHCYSACVLIWISGVERRVDRGRWGVHRPYLASESADSNEVRFRYETLTVDVDKYVSEMGVDSRFYNLMMNTPPDQIRVFEPTEIYELVPREDPLHQEIRTNALAKLYEIPIIEYRQRVADSELCPEDDSECYSAAMWGVSKGTFLRAKESYDECRIPEEIRIAMRSLKRSERMLSAPEVERYKCRKAALNP